MNDETKTGRTLIMPLMLDGKERAVRFTGNDADRLASHTIQELTAKFRAQGAAKLETMFRSGKPLAVFTLTIDDYDMLLDKGKASGIFYAVLGDKVNEQDVFDIFIKSDDVTAFCDLILKHKMKHKPQYDAGVCIEEPKQQVLTESGYHCSEQPTAQNHRRYTTEVKEKEQVVIPPRPNPADYHTADGKIRLQAFLDDCQKWKNKYDTKRRIHMNLTPEEEAILHPPFGQRTSVRAKAEIIKRHMNDGKK